MPVGVVDVGSNTVRLLATSTGQTLLSEREMLHLGADVERLGRISDEKLAEVSAVVARFAADARAAGVDVHVLVTSPGRQAANGDELVDALAEAADAPVRVLSAAEEGRLAFVGAVACVSPPARRTVAVVDVGGGSAQVVVGTRRDGPRWSRSLDVGSQRLTSRLGFADPAGAAAVGAARAEVERLLESFDPPTPHTAYAVGGSARALKRIAGSRLTPADLEDALELLAATPSGEVAERFGITAERAETLTAGCVILAALRQRLGVPLKVVRGGLREGALAELARAERAAA